MLNNPKTIGDIITRLAEYTSISKDLLDAYEKYCNEQKEPDNYAKIYFALLDMSYDAKPNEKNYNLLFDFFLEYYNTIKKYFEEWNKRYFLETMEAIYKKGKLPEINQESFKYFFLSKYS
jgi:hypothetical protein